MCTLCVFNLCAPFTLNGTHNTCGELYHQHHRSLGRFLCLRLCFVRSFQRYLLFIYLFFLPFFSSCVLPLRNSAIHEHICVLSVHIASALRVSSFNFKICDGKQNVFVFAFVRSHVYSPARTMILLCGNKKSS